MTDVRSKTKVSLFCGFHPERRHWIDAIVFAAVACDLHPITAAHQVGNGIARSEIIDVMLGMSGLVVVEATPFVDSQGIPHSNTIGELQTAKNTGLQVFVLVESKDNFHKSYSNWSGYDVIAHDGKGEAIVRKLLQALQRHDTAKDVFLFGDLRKTLNVYRLFKRVIDERCHKKGIANDDDIVHRIEFIEQWTHDRALALRPRTERPVRDHSVGSGSSRQPISPSGRYREN